MFKTLLHIRLSKLQQKYITNKSEIKITLKSKSQTLKILTVYTSVKYVFCYLAYT
jgi:hypothetical protein